jgi:hypothetical protein
MKRSKPIIDFAIDYAKKLHLSTIPVNPKNKKPLIKWQLNQKKKAGSTTIKKWFVQYPDAGLGIVTGKLSGLFVVDCDTSSGYQSTMDLIPKDIITPTVKTPKGWHLYFKYPSANYLTVGQRILPGVDFRGEGGFVVSPPTVNGNGDQYKWLDGLSLFEIDPPEIPKTILDLIPSPKKKTNKKKPVEHVDRPGFAMITNEVICSDAYKSLTNPARTAYTLMLAQIKKKGQPEVIYPYSHAADYMERRTFTTATRQLIEVGFIDKKQSGGLFRRTNIYLFCDRWRGFNPCAEKPSNQRGEIKERKKERVVAI